MIVTEKTGMICENLRRNADGELCFADMPLSPLAEKYGISENAVYFDGKYLPLSAIKKIIVKPSVYFPGHSCGKGIPVFKMGLDYGSEKFAVLMIENVDKISHITRSQILV